MVMASKILGMNVSAFAILALCLALAYVTGRVADGKGYSYPLFALLGLLFPLIGLIVALVLPDKNASSPTTETDNAEALARYKALLDDGTLTQEEFDAKKSELLS